MIFLTSQFSGWQCDGGVSLGISNQETINLVMVVLEKFDPGKSFAWHSLGFEVQEVKGMNVHKAINVSRSKETWLQRNLKESKGSGRRVQLWSRFLDRCVNCSLIERNFSPCFRCFWHSFLQHHCNAW